MATVTQTAPPAAPPAALLVRILPVTLAHTAVDLAQSAVPALVPYLVSRFGLNYAEAGGLVLAGTVSSSVTQPLFGVIADRYQPRWLLAAGVIIAGVGAAACGVAPNYPTALVLVCLSGLGVAAFHPEAARVARGMSGARRATGMAYFSIGGNAGFAFGPIIVGGAAAASGSASGSLVLVPITMLMAGYLWACRDRLVDAGAALLNRVAARDRWGGLWLLLASTGLRGYVYFTLLTFVPLFEERVRHHSHGYGEALLALVLASGVVGSLALGWLGDRIDQRWILTGSFLIAGPAIAVYLMVGGPVGIVAVAVSGAALIGTFGITIVMSQQYLPSRAGFAASLSIGCSMGLGGVASLAIGRLADSVGLLTAMKTSILVAGLGVLVTLALPDPGRE
jgi:MFS transporter, FSR family, fosmidomycin resistance protein